MKPRISTSLVIALLLASLLEACQLCARTHADDVAPFTLFPQPSQKSFLSQPLDSFNTGWGKDFTILTDYRPAEYQGKNLTPGFAHREALFTLRPDARSYLSAKLLDTLVLPRYTTGQSDPLQSALGDKRLSLPTFSDQMRAAQRGLRGQQWAGVFGDLSGSFSQLDIGKIPPTSSLQPTVNRLNQQWASRAQNALSPNTSFALKDLTPLTGAEQQDFSLRYAPSQKLNLATEGNEIATPSGNVQFRDTRLQAGALSLSQRERSVDSNATDALLKGLGRDDLLPLRGVKDSSLAARVAPSQKVQFGVDKYLLQTPQGEVQERTAQMKAGGFSLLKRQTSVGQNLNNALLQSVGRQDLVASKGVSGDETLAEWRTKKFTLSTLRRTEEVSQVGGFLLGGTTENQIQRNGLTLNLSPSSTLQATQERITSAPKEEEDDALFGASNSVQRMFTVQLSQKISKATSAVVSRQQSVLTEGERIVRADETATQFRTDFKKLTRLMVDWRQRDSSDGRDSGGKRFSLALKPSSSFSLNTMWQDDFIGVEQRSAQYSVSLTQKLDEQRQVNLLTNAKQSIVPGALTESQNQMVSVNPWRGGSLLEYARLLQVNNVGRLERNQLMFHQPFGNATRLVLRGVSVENNLDKDFSHGFFIESKQKRLTLQAGQEEVMGVGGRFEPVNFVRVAAKPHKAFAFDWGTADRRDLMNDSLALTDWKVESDLLGVKLSARGVRNKPVGTLKESILPTLMNGVNQVSERSYAVALPTLFKRFNLSGAYTANEDLRSGLMTNGYTFTLSDAPGGAMDFMAKYTLGKQFPTLGLNDYSAYELTYRYYLGADYYVNFNGRSLFHEDPAKKVYNLDFSLGWKW